MTDDDDHNIFWAGRPVAVTGATGFIGSQLTAALVDLGASVAVLTRDRVPAQGVIERWWDVVTRVDGDLSDPAVLERLLGEYAVETAFHLAAQSQVGVANANPRSTFESNIRGTWNLLEAARDAPNLTGVVVASTDKAYGTQPSLPYTEDMPLRAVHPYDVSKACADLITASYAEVFDVPAVITRCGNVYGPGDVNWQRIVPGTIRSLLRDESPVLRSDGSMVRDYVYADDVVQGYLALAECLATDRSLAGEAFNLSTGQPASVLDVVNLITELMGASLAPTILGRATHEIDAQYLSPVKAERRLGWQPIHDLRSGLELTIDWYREHFKQ